MCRAIVIVFFGAYLIALFLLAVGTFGWFGQERDPLSGVFLVPLGVPWNLLLEGVPEPLKLPVGIISPLLNIGLLILVCRRFRGR